jgi:hypothetical protein
VIHLSHFATWAPREWLGTVRTGKKKSASIVGSGNYGMTAQVADYCRLGFSSCLCILCQLRCTGFGNEPKAKTHGFIVIDGVHHLVRYGRLATTAALRRSHRNCDEIGNARNATGTRLHDQGVMTQSFLSDFLQTSEPTSRSLTI